MAPNMLDLPDELLIEILQYLPKTDLKSARLSSSWLGAIGASMLFHRVYFAPRKFEIERFRNIAQHPVFSKTIKELVYDARLFREEYQETEAYLAMLSRQTRSSRDPLRIDLSGLGRYSDCVEEQAHILDNKLDYHALLADLGRMSIQCLTIQDVFHNHDQIPLHLSEHTWYDEQCQLRFPKFLPSKWSEFPLPNEWNYQAAGVFTWDCRGLAHLFHAFSEHCTSIHELHIGTQRSKAPLAPQVALSTTLTG